MPADYPYVEITRQNRAESAGTVGCHRRPSTRLQPMSGCGTMSGTEARGRTPARSARTRVMTIRNARPGDAKAIATIHVRAWQTAYRGIVPWPYLSELSIDQREQAWRQRLERGVATVLLAEESDQVLGWISAGTSRDVDAGAATGEVYALYVAPEHWRHGVGRQLWDESAKRLRDAGFTEATLWVLRDNSRARAFYGSNGFADDAGIEKAVRLGGADLLEVRLRNHIRRPLPE
jgi:ribosomal protein S18 acetylase RimI-like enzyme